MYSQRNCANHVSWQREGRMIKIKTALSGYEHGIDDDDDDDDEDKDAGTDWTCLNQRYCVQYLDDGHALW